MSYGFTISARFARAAMVFMILFAGIVQNPPAADLALTCVICDKTPLVGKVWIHKIGHICDDCFKLDTRCSICSVPAKSGFAKTSDGRIICKSDLKEAVLIGEEAQRIFEETRRDLKTMSGGVLAVSTPVITVNLFDIDYWNYLDGAPLANDLRRAGFSSSRRSGNQFTHSVLLHSSLRSIEPRSGGRAEPGARASPAPDRWQSICF